MKIAVPSKNGEVDNHFGHCAYYTRYTLSGNEVKMKEIMPSPQGCGCKSGVVFDLRRKGVQVMLAGNIGEGAKNVLESNEIKVVRGCCGPVDELVAAYIAGNVVDNGEICAHHNCSGH